MNILYYIAATTLGFTLSFVGIVFAAVSGELFAYAIGSSLAAAHIWSFFYAHTKAKQGKVKNAVLALISPIFIVWAGLFLLLTLYLLYAAIFP